MVDFKEINRAAIQALPWLLPEILPGGKFHGREYRCGDLAGGQGQSFAINTESGRWADFATGDKGGDVINLMAKARGISQGEAAKFLTETMGINGTSRQSTSPRIFKRKVPSEQAPAKDVSQTRRPYATPQTPTEIRHLNLGIPSATWEYHDPTGSLIGYACRFDTPEGKQVLPYTFGQDGWLWRAWTEPRPLYGLDRLAERPDATVLVVEGEKTADAAQRLFPEMVVLTWPGGSSATGMVDFSPLKGRRVVLWPDVDEPGRDAINNVADNLERLGVAELSIVNPPQDVKRGWDLADAEVEGWDTEKATSWIKSHRQAISPPDISEYAKAESLHPYSRFRFKTAADLTREIKPTEWLVEGIVEAFALIVLFADPGSYKTFLAISLGLSIATGTPWYGRPVKKGLVVFIIGEGSNGFAKRLKAWSLSTGVKLDDAALIVSTAPAQLLDEGFAAHVRDCIAAEKERFGDPVLIIIDTLARNFGNGDENSTQDMTKFVSNLDSYLPPCTREIIHHTGHGEKSRGRGSSALKGAVDAEMFLEKTDMGVTLSCLKMKDAPPFAPMSFQPVTVDIETTDPERPETSLYLVESNFPKINKEKLSPQMRQALGLLDLMTRKVSPTCLQDWMHLCVSEQVYSKSPFYTAVQNMEDKNILVISNGYVKRS